MSAWGGGGGGESKSRRSPPGKSKQLFLAVWGIFLLLFSSFWGPFTPYIRAFLLLFSPYGDLFSMCVGGGGLFWTPMPPRHSYTFIPSPSFLYLHLHFSITTPQSSPTTTPTLLTSTVIPILTTDYVLIP